MKFRLRDYQAENVNQIREAMKGGRATLYSLPTGGGKTAVFSYITEAASAKGNRVTILVHRQELLIQSSLSLAEMGVQHGLVCPQDVFGMSIAAQKEEFGEIFTNSNSRVLVASVQTLVRRLNLLEKTDLLIIDEAHHAAAGSWEKCIEALPEKAKILGVTATPRRLDGKGLGNFFNSMVHGPQIQELIDSKYLCAPKLFAPTTVDLSGAQIRYGDYKKSDAEKAMSKPKIVGDAVGHYSKLCPNVPAIAFCCTVKHSEEVAEKFRSAGYRAASLDGNMSKYARRKILKDLAQGELDLVSSCDVISEGTDVPLVGAAILLRPTKSLSLYLQQVGRALRRYPDAPIMQRECMKKLVDGDTHYAYILDHANNSAEHGLPQSRRDWALDYKKGKPDLPAIKTCLKCYAVYSATKSSCPHCGFTPEGRGVEVDRTPMEVDGDLQEVRYTPDWAGGRDLLAMPLKKALAFARTPQQLHELARAKGYNPNWARNVLNARAKRNMSRG